MRILVIKISAAWSSRCGTAETNPTKIHEVQSLASISGLKIWCCSELWCRSQTRLEDPELLWLWCRPAAAAPIQLLAWELPYAMGGALKRQQTKTILSSILKRKPRSIKSSPSVHCTVYLTLSKIFLSYFSPHFNVSFLSDPTSMRLQESQETSPSLFCPCT